MDKRHSIHIEQTGEVFTCADTQNVLRGMEALGRRGIPVGCRGGGCGVCKIRVTSGEFKVRKMSRAYVSEAEEAEGIVLACKTFPLSDLSVSVVGKMVKNLTRPLQPAGTGDPSHSPSGTAASA
ncbi:2Fe-2S iron-sulfur cluster binding domain-containing protein [Azoarcus taiwanensis]|uniref:2Fe-2S iron-sulfur cluster binding domain-containing protein n=1 Tax=Azoarcus taiwanensis TaxID=666964 RepID=A0A972F6I6_9RHOO|nr:2Fe-2S iron-sulfur cluster binding domain-containing protein [Azoarcus taiwanensis]NMG01880.1 2Fe-2S iron-sulfur cluster binding domain-containing protein [Azoarcus taiwanensis]